MTSIYRRTGDVSLPITLADVTSGIFPDPARDNTLALFAQAINSELAAAWTSALAGTPMAGTSPVENTLPMEPTIDIVEQFKQALPLLAFHRTGAAEYTEHTLSLEKRTQTWQLHYILSPLRVDHVHKVSGTLVYVPTIIQAVLHQQGHPDYESGAVQFGQGDGRFSTLRLVNHEVGQAVFAGDSSEARYMACSMTLESEEIATFTSEDVFAPLEGVQFELGVGGGAGVLPGVIYADTDNIPPLD